MGDLYEKASYDRARNRIERIKGFFMHLLIFITVNVLTYVAGLIGFGIHPTAWENCLEGTLKIGGLSVLIHAAIVYGPSLINKKGWEQQKLQELLKQERLNNTNQK